MDSDTSEGNISTSLVLISNEGKLKLLIYVNFVHLYLWLTCNIIFVTGDADDAALRSLRGDWKTYSRLRGLTIEVSSRVTHEDHENGAVSTSEGGAVSLPIKLLPRRSALLIPILTFAHIWRTPGFRYTPLEMRSTSSLSSHLRRWYIRTRAAVWERINRENTQGFPLVYLAPPTYLFIHLR